MEPSEEHPSISKIFDDQLTEFMQIEESTLSSNSDEFQNKVKSMIQEFEKATLLVTRLGIFSSNEIIDEVSTNSIKFLLLPAMLGLATLRSQGPPRTEILRVAFVYLRDFLVRCEKYGFGKTIIPELHEELVPENNRGSSVASKVNKMPTPQEFQQMATLREQKIHRFKAKQDAMSQLKSLKLVTQKTTCDDEDLRKYYITLVKKYMFECEDEIQSVKVEHDMLAQMAAIKCGTGEDTRDTKNGTDTHKPQPLKTFLLTRDTIEKAVLGMGYPSLPKMSVEEFYEKRYASTKQVDRNEKQRNQTERKEDGENTQEEEEEEEKERRNQMERDEWKDWNKKGWGNTHNRS